MGIVSRTTTSIPKSSLDSTMGDQSESHTSFDVKDNDAEYQACALLVKFFYQNGKYGTKAFRKFRFHLIKITSLNFLREKPHIKSRGLKGMVMKFETVRSLAI